MKIFKEEIVMEDISDKITKGDITAKPVYLPILIFLRGEQNLSSEEIVSEIDYHKAHNKLLANANAYTLNDSCPSTEFNDCMVTTGMTMLRIKGDPASFLVAAIQLYELC